MLLSYNVGERANTMSKSVIGTRIQIVNGKEVTVKILQEGHHGEGFFANKSKFIDSYKKEEAGLQRDIQRADDREVEANAPRWKLHL